MKDDRPINKAVEESLGALDSLQKADPGPWFAAKVMRRWEEESSDQTVSSRRPIWQLAALAVLLLLNLGFVLRQPSQNEDRSEYLQAFAEEYDFSTDSYVIY
ncbi:MAG: hypothetical protein AAFP02_02510 [Bacteroidota bacterium]